MTHASAEGCGVYPSSLGIAAVKGGHRGEPAVHPTVAAATDKDNLVIRQVDWLDVVEVAVGELFQAGTIAVDFVKMIVVGASGAIGEEDLFAAVVNLRVADASMRVI